MEIILSNCIGNKIVQQHYIKMFKYQMNAQDKQTQATVKEKALLFSLTTV